MRSLSKKLQLRFTLSFILVIGSVILSFTTLRSLVKSNEDAQKLSSKLEKLKEIKFQVPNAVSNVRGYILTRDEIFLEDYKKAYPVIKKNYEALYSINQNDTFTLNRLNRLKALIDERFGILNLILKIYTTGQEELKGLTRYGHTVTKRINEQIWIIEEESFKKINTILQESDNQRLYTFLITTLSYLLAFTLLFFTIREFVKSDKKEKQTHKLLLEAQNLSKIGNYEWLPEKNTLIWSDALYKIYGYEPGEIPLSDLISLQKKLIHPDDVIYHNHLMQKLVSKPGNYTFGWKIMRKDGSQGWVEGAGESIADRSGKVIRVFGYLQDVTTQKLKEQELQQAREKLQQLNTELEAKVESRTEELAQQNLMLIKSVEQQIYFREQIREKEETLELAIQSTDIGTWDYYPATDLMIWSDRSRELFGFPSQVKLNYKLFLSQIHPDDRKRVNEAMQLAMEPKGNGKLNIDLKTLPNTNSEYKWLNARGRVFFDEKGKPERFIGIVADVTPSRQLAEKKDEFIGIASHELKTPITSMKAYLQIVELMLKEKKYDNLDEFIKKAHNHVEKLTGLINDLLDVTKIQAGKMEMNITEFDLEALVDETIKHIQHSSPTHKIYREGNIPQKVKADRNRIEQVLTNYLTNAVKYSPKADKVIVSLSQTAEQAKVAVTDFGIGIPKAKLPHLFEKFYRVEEQTKKFAGLGLGLNIASEIIKRHGGETWVESEYGKGSTFYFTLPA